jgi:two-component system, NtrC family, response regulator GlrR
MNRLETKRNKILLVDDHLPILDLLSMRLASVGYETMTAPSGEDAIAQLSVTRPDLMITDLRMDGMDGMALFDYVHERHPQLPVIILTAHGSIPEAVRATKRGVFGFLTKPFEAEELLGQVADALRLTGDEGGAGPVAAEEWCRDVLTRSPVMEELLTRTKLVAQGDGNVLIQGESGTGKDVLAQAIHAASSRAAGPFVALNCGAVTEALLESELFGHTKGSISGAATSSPGVLRAASGGTLFLDEVGEMPSALQVKLLRVLQEKRVRPLGSTEYVSVDVRVLSATRRDLEQEVAAGAFREDLYYRLNVLRLDVPALAERREDIPLLANHFLREVAEAAGKPVRGFAPQAMEALMAGGWPGNVRQLRNVVEQAALLTTSPIVSPQVVRQAMGADSAEIQPFSDARREFERDYFVRILKATGGNVSRAAVLAERNRTEFYKLLQRHKLTPADFRSTTN